MISEGDKEMQRLVRRGKTNTSVLNQPNQKRPGYDWGVVLKENVCKSVQV